LFYLILSILSAALLAVAMRLSEGKINSKLSMLAINYLACMIVGVGYMGADHLIPSGEGVVPMLGMGLINGIFYAWGLVMNQKNTSLNGVVLTSVFSKMGGLLIPLAVSIVLFREDPTLVQILGFVISTVAIVMICQRGEESGSGKIYIGALVMLFAADGFGGIMAKVFREMGNPLLGDHFLFLTFLTAFVICIVIVAVKKEQPGKNELFYGILIGVPNFMQARFQLLALETIPAVVVYPVRSVGTILVITLAGVLMFREKLNKKQLAALAAILVSLVLLNV